MSDETRTESQPRTPTDVLIAAMESADDMEECMVIFRLKPDENNLGGMGWATMHETLHQKLAFIEEAKFSMCHTIYGCEDK